MASALLTNHPGKSIWTLIAIAFNLARLPFWMVLYIPAVLRQTKKYSYNKAIRVRVMKAFLTHLSQVELKTPESLKAGAEGKQFVVIEPAPSSAYTGVVLKDPKIKPKEIGGTWYPAPLVKFTGTEEVVIHYHGGAYVIGDGRKEATAFAAINILAGTAATHVFCPQYRLSSNPLGRFPAALQDAITAFQHVTQIVGVPAKNVTVSGDSAGGNLTLALLRYIHDQPEAGLSSPTCAFLWSLWADPGGSLVAGGLANLPNAKTDYLPADFGAWGARTYAPSKSSGLTLDDVHIAFTPEHAFQTPTPIFFTTGDCEALYHDVVKVSHAFSSIEGNKCELYVEKGAPHDIVLTGATNGFEKEARESAIRAGRFLAGLKR